MEKTVVRRLNEHLSLNNLYEQNQSAYRKYHGTETALLKVHNDILCELDNKCGVVLILLDNTIDQDILFKRLESIGVGGSALRWFQSYLCSRSQAVNTNATVSSHVCLPYGVHIGSVLGPILFAIYSSPIASIAQKQGLHIHAYADDTQLYTPFDLNNPIDEMFSCQRAEACILEIKSWMSSNKLKLNDEKTEFLVMTSIYQQHKIHDHNIKIDTATIHTSKKKKKELIT